MNIKKIIMSLMLVVLAGSVAVSGEEDDTKNKYTAKIQTYTENNRDYVSKTTPNLKVEKEKKIIGYGPIRSEGGEYVADKIYRGESKEVQFKTEQEVDFAATNKLTNKKEFDEKIISLQSDPTDNNIQILKQLKKNTISVEGYISITDNNLDLYKLKNEEFGEIKLGMDPDEKKEIELEIKKLEEEIENNIQKFKDNPPSIEQQGEILGSLNEDEQGEILKAIADKKCLKSWNPFCEFFAEQSGEQAIKTSFLVNIDTSIEDKDKYNKALYGQLNEMYNVVCDSSLSCEKKIEKLKQEGSYMASCEISDNVCREKKIKEIESILDLANKQVRVETNWLFSVFDAIQNQDQSARASAKFFGFGADYDDLPNWLAEQGVAASQICLGEIDGYLDEDASLGGSTIKSSGDLTKYGYEFGINTTTLDVAYDIRAKRTKTTPDGESYMTVSVYLKAPTNDNITYMLGLSYKSGDRFYKKSLLNKTTILAGEEISELYPYDIKVNHPTEVHEGSFFIYLKARTGSGTVIANDNTNVYLVINGEDNNVVLGNNEGNKQDSTNEDVELETDTFWEGFDE